MTTDLARDENEPRRALGAFLATREWDHWVTLTPAEPTIRPPAMIRAFERRFIRRLAKRAQRPIRWARMLERSPGGLLHFHALLYGTAAIPAERIAGAWGLGRADVERYDRARGAAWYLSKLYGDDGETSDGFDLSRKLPPAAHGAQENEPAIRRVA